MDEASPKPGDDLINGRQGRVAEETPGQKH
jgi:hypothetical protein